MSDESIAARIERLVTEEQDLAVQRDSCSSSGAGAGDIGVSSA